MLNENTREVGVVVNKLVGNRIMAKRIHAQVEHLRPSWPVSRRTTPKKARPTGKEK